MAMPVHLRCQPKIAGRSLRAGRRNWTGERKRLSWLCWSGHDQQSRDGKKAKQFLHI
jgi:hypothetical protein